MQIIPRCRNGAAAIEAVLLLPILILVTLASIDVGQYIDLSQLVTNASREGARIASHDSTVSASQVESTIFKNIAEAYANLSESELQSSLNVVIRNQDGTVLNNDLTSIKSGERLSVEVSFDFHKIRWLNGFDYWSGSANQSITVGRRD